jgi:hypothetical protein
VITVRAARSTSCAATPGRTASNAACWAAKDDRVDLALFLGGFAHEDGPSEVRAVLVAHAPEVHHDGVAAFDPSLPRLVVARGAVGARTDDREVDALMAVLAEEAVELEGDLGFGAADERPRDYVGERGIRGAPGGAESPDLVGVLHRPQQREGLRGGEEGAARRGTLEREQVRRPRPVAHRVASRAEHGGDDPVGIVAAVLPVEHGQPRCSGRRLRERAFERRDHQRRVGPRRQHEQRQAFSGGGAYAVR